MEPGHEQGLETNGLCDTVLKLSHVRFVYTEQKMGCKKV